MHYFCLDNLLYHDKIIIVLYDKSGKQYGKGKGFKIFVNGIEKASAKTLQRINLVIE